MKITCMSAPGVKLLGLFYLESNVLPWCGLEITSPFVNYGKNNVSLPPAGRPTQLII